MTMVGCATASAEKTWKPPFPSGSHVTDQPNPSISFPLVHDGKAATVVVESEDWKVARIAAGDLVADIERVTGQKPLLAVSYRGLRSSAVFVGTIGKSRMIDALISEGKLDVDDIKGEWESFVIQEVSDPFSGG